MGKEEKIIESIWKKSVDSSFAGQTYSRNSSGFKILFQAPNTMYISGGNLRLPNFISLQLKDDVKFFFDHEKYIKQKWISKKDHHKVLDKLDQWKTNPKKLDDNWQILRLLDPRSLLKKGSYKIWGSKPLHKFLEITLEFDLKKLYQKEIIKISNEFLEWFQSQGLEKRIVKIYVDHQLNLSKILQKELLPPFENISIKFNYSRSTIDIPEIAPLS